MGATDGSRPMTGDRPRPRPHHLDQRYLEERFKALEDRIAVLERLVPVEEESFDEGGWTRRLD